MENLFELSCCCQLLNSDKITERKKQVDKLRTLLSSEKILHALDKSTDRKSTFTWNCVLKSVQLLMFKEAEYLQKDKPSTGANLSSNLEKKKSTCSGIFKFVIRKANERGQRIKCKTIMEHIQEIVMNSSAFAAFGLDYCNVLLKDFLNIRLLWCEIPSYILKELLHHFCKVYRKSDQGFSKILLLQIIKRMIEILSQQTTFEEDYLFPFFKELLKELRQEKSSSQQKAILKTSVTFCYAVIEDNHNEVCCLGADSFSNILEQWTQKPCDQIKEALLEFIELQVISHYKLIFTDLVNRNEDNYELWKKHATELYKIFVNELNEICSRNKYSPRSWNLTSKFLYVMVLICEQVKNFESHQFTDDGNRKRFKLQNTFGDVMDHVSQQYENGDVVLWLKMISMWLEKFPTVLSSHQLQDLMIKLMSMLNNCKRTQTVEYIIDVFNSCIRCQQYLEKNKQMNKEGIAFIRKTWIHIYEKALHSLILNATQEIYLKVIYSLLQLKLISPRNEFWHLFSENTKPSNYLIAILIMFVKQYDIPEENIQNTLLWGKSSLPSEQHRDVFRLHLFNWLLPLPIDDDGNIRSLARVSIDLLSTVLAALCLRDPSDFLSSWNLKYEQMSQKDYASPLEENFLKISNIICFEVLKIDDKDHQYQSIIWPSVANALLELLSKHLEILMENTELKDQILFIKIDYYHLIIKLLPKFVTLGIIDSSSVHQHQLSKIALRLMTQLFMKFNSNVAQDLLSDLSFHLLLDNLSMLKINSSLEAFLLRSTFSQELMTPFFILVKNMMIHISVRKKTQIAGRDEFEEKRLLDEDLNNLEISRNEDIPEDDEKDDKTFQKLCRDMILFICGWCEWNATTETTNLTHTPEIESIKLKLLEILLNDNLDMKNSFLLHMELDILRILSSNNHYHDDQSLADILKLLKKLCNVHFKDMRIMTNCVEILTALMHHVSSSNENNKNSVLQLLHGFWKLKNSDKLSTEVLIRLINCIAAVTKIDPENAWCKWPTEDNTSSLPVFLSVIELLGHPLQRIQLQAASVIPSIVQYYEEKGLFLNFFAKWQHVFMKKIIDTLNEKYQQCNQIDAKIKVFHVGLKVLSEVACASPHIEEPSLFAILEMSVNYDIPAILVTKAISNISTFLQYSSLESYIKSHAKYIFFRWISMNKSLDQFPYLHISIKNKTDLVHVYFRELVTALFLQQECGGINSILEILDISYTQLITRCFPSIISPILLSKEALTFQNQEIISFYEKKFYLSCSNCDTIVQKELETDYKDIIINHLKEIVIEIITLQEDELIGNKDLISSFWMLPTYSEAVIVSTLNKTAIYCSNGEKNLLELLIENPEDLQMILLCFKTSVITSHRIYRRWKAFLSYKLFINLLQDNLKYLSNIKAFITKDVIATLTSILTNDKETMCTTVDESLNLKLISVSLNILENFCLSLVKIYPEELGRSLPSLISSLLHLIYKPVFKPQIISFLKNILIENMQPLLSYIRNLDPLPSIPELEQLNALFSQLKCENGELSLEKEISCFLNSKELTDINNRSDALHYLKQKLSCHKQELKQLIHQFSALYGFSEAFENCSLFYQLLTELLHICVSSTSKIAMIAAQCLGNIGPVNLPTLVFQKYSYVPQYKPALLQLNANSLVKRNVLILEMLENYLFNHDVHLVQKTSRVLKNIFSDKYGKNFLDSCKDKIDENLTETLLPFMNTKDILDADEFFNTPEEIVNCFENFLTSYNNYETWIKDIVCMFVSKGFILDKIIIKLLPVLEMKADFCETLFPFIIHAALEHENEVLQNHISKFVSQFFSQHCEINDSDCSKSDISTPSRISNIALNKQAVKSMLSVIEFLRHQRKRKKSEIAAWESNEWLELNYLDIAKTASFCSASFTALMYLEIWSDCFLRMTPTYRKNQPCTNGSPEDYYTSTSVFMSTLLSYAAKDIHQLLVASYSNIGESDGIYGCDSSFLVRSEGRIQFYEQENMWDKALCAYDKEASTCGSSLGLLKSLMMMELPSVLDVYMKGLNFKQQEKEEELTDFQYECAWKLSQWDLPRHSGLKDSFNQSVYKVLLALKTKDTFNFTKNVEVARKIVIKELKDASLESTHNVSRYLTKFKMLNLMEDYEQHLKKSEDGIKSLTNSWCFEDEMFPLNYKLIEPVISMQITLLKFGSSSINLDCLGKRLAQKIHVTKESKYLEASLSAVSHLKNLKQTDKVHHWKCQMEEACLFWQRNEKNTALYLIKDLLSSLEDLSIDDTLNTVYAEVLGLYSSWLIDTRAENPNVISGYLRKAIKLCSHLRNDAALTDAFLSAARFADSHYKRVHNYINSPMFKSKQESIDVSRKTAATLKSCKNLSREQQKAVFIMEKQSSLDEQEVMNMKKDLRSFLTEAIQNYSNCLKAGENHNLRIFRLISLWFQNQDAEINLLLKKHVKEIKSYKLLPLMHQLAARMNNKPDSFQDTLNQVIEQTVIDHPHHSLMIILALQNAYKDDVFLNSGSKSKKSNGCTSETKMGEERMIASKNLINRLRKKEHLKNMIANLEQLCDAYISLANFTSFTGKLTTVKIPSDQIILKIQNFENVAIPTMNLPISPDGNYNQVIGITAYETNFKLCSGLSVPKLLTCIGSDGKKRKQLLKGKDDLRQDAVMQQVFGIVNIMLHENEETKKRNLSIRTYKVVPLSQRSGILEWCEGTQHFGEFLIGKKGAHCRYYPSDLSADECRKIMTQKSKSTIEEKFNTFQDICKRFRPVFRHFFLENFPQPSTWFERRLAYTRSVAVSSIVGYMLGLGDRHVQNILIDNVTAEFIHIDLGVAFDQGKILPIPETVPFRLTRDIVDGMGITGVEGIYRRTCEKTFEVLQQAHEIVLTIVEVFLYDPLYSWSLSPAKAYKVQHKNDKYEFTETCASTKNDDINIDETAFKTFNSSENDVNSQAERILVKLQQKLQGFEDGRTMNISNLVNHLIQEAADPKNLCRIFPGWQPYL